MSGLFHPKVLTMNAPTNTKAELLSKVVEHVDITAYDARPVIDAMRKMSFTSRDTARAADILNMAIADKDCSPWLILAGSTSAGGCMHVYRDMVKFGMVDAVVATGASIVDMDFFEALGFKHYQAQSNVDDRDLRALYIDRIYDTYIDEEELQACDHTILQIANSLEPKAYSSRAFIREMGKWLQTNGWWGDVTLGQQQFGYEISGTGGSPLTFTTNSYNLSYS